MWTISYEALVYVVILCVVMEITEGGSREITAFSNTYMDNTVIRTGSLYSENVASPGQCCIMCLSTNSCVSFYYNSISQECLPHSKIYQPSDSSTSELNWKYYIAFDESGIWWNFQGHKYSFTPNSKRKQAEAKSYCESIGAYIVQIETQDEQTWLINQITERMWLWIGLNDLAIQGQYVWGDYTAVPLYYNWDYGEPDYATERCVAMLMTGTTGKWHDVSCDFVLDVICEK